MTIDELDKILARNEPGTEEELATALEFISSAMGGFDFKLDDPEVVEMLKKHYIA